MKKMMIKLVSILVLLAMALSLSSAAASAPNGADGKDGKDGLTPYIGENGNWWLGDTDSGTPAGGISGAAGTAGNPGKDGKDGEDGINGVNGEDGIDGIDAYAVAVENGFTGTYYDWLNRDSDTDTSIIDYLVSNSGLNTVLSALLNSHDFVNLMGYVSQEDINNGADVSDAIQKAIDENPGKTIYVPDGIYMLSKPVKTSAKEGCGVSFSMSNHAEFRAHSSWSGAKTDALLMIGAIDTDKAVKNDRNAFVEGGIFNGRWISSGITICAGDGVRLENISIKHTVTGIHVQKGTTADIIIVNVVGDKAKGSIGVLLDSEGSTIDGMRIAHVEIGVKLRGSNNFLRDIHPLYTCGNNDIYLKSYAFYEDEHPEGGSGADNYYDFCYSDQFRTAYRLLPGSKSVFKNCFTMWYADYGDEIGYDCEYNFCAYVMGTKVSFRNDSCDVHTIEEACERSSCGFGNNSNNCCARHYTTSECNGDKANCIKTPTASKPCLIHKHCSVHDSAAKCKASPDSCKTSGTCKRHTRGTACNAHAVGGVKVDCEFGNHYLLMKEVSGTGIIEFRIADDAWHKDSTYKQFVVEYTRGK